MSQNLHLLRQNYCRPTTLTGKRSRDLFHLEKECEEGKALLAKTPNTLLHLQEFDPYGLHQTYRDDSTGAELPVFAVFDLEGRHQIACEITTDSVSETAQTNSLPGYIPFEKTQAFVMKINDRRMKAERAVTRLAVILGILPVLTYIFTHITVMATAALPYVLMGGWSLGTFLAYLSGLFVLNRLLPRKNSSSQQNLTVSFRKKPGKRHGRPKTSSTSSTSSSTSSTVGRAHSSQIRGRVP